MTHLSRVLDNAGIPEDLKRQIREAVMPATLAFSALRRINDTIYAQGAPLGSDAYFTIRTLAVDALRAAGEPVRKD